MKTKHNKKRNTAFLFEVLVRELTKSLVQSDSKRSKKIKTIIKEHFSQGSILFKELDCFNCLSKTTGLDNNTAEKLVFHAKKKHAEIDPDDIFAEQSRLIKKVNQDLSPTVFSNFVPNYKSFATISQIFNSRTPIKKRVLMERQILNQLTLPTETNQELKPVDSLVLKTFTKSYNKKYNNLLPEQKDVLARFINLNEDTRHDFSLFLLEKLQKIEEQIVQSLEMPEIKEDEDMTKNTQRVLEQLKKINVTNFDHKEMLSVLKLQKLVKEYHTDDN